MPRVQHIHVLCDIPSLLQWTDVVLVRKYGENTDLIIDRKAEQRNMVFLHSIGSGAPLYAVLNNALVYGFIPGKITDMKTIRDPAIRELVAKEMAKMHYSVDLKSRSGMCNNMTGLRFIY